MVFFNIYLYTISPPLPYKLLYNCFLPRNSCCEKTALELSKRSENKISFTGKVLLIHIGNTLTVTLTLSVFPMYAVLYVNMRVISATKVYTKR